MDTSRMKALPLFEGVSDEDLDKISPFVSEVSVSEGKHLVDEGDYAYEFMAIEEGEAEVVRGDETLANLGPGDYFGEIALIDGGPRSATVTAATDLICYGLTFWEFRPLVERNGTIGWKLLQVLAKRLRAADP